MTSCAKVLLVSALIGSLVGAAHAQMEPTAAGFPPTPTPQPKAPQMTEAQLKEYILPGAVAGQKDNTLAIVYNGYRRSQMDPCGCVSHQLGGLDKEAMLHDQLEAQGVKPLKVDAGGIVKDLPSQNDIRKSEYLLKAYAKLGYEAVNVAFTDVTEGADKLKKAAEDAGVKLVSANITDDSGNTVFDPYVIAETEVGGKSVKVAFLGVSRARAMMNSAGTSGTQAMKSGGLTFAPPAEAIAKYAAEAAEKSDVLVVLAYERRDRGAALLEKLEDKALVDVVITGENVQQVAAKQDLEGVTLVSGGYEGRQFGTLFLQMKDGKIESSENRLVEVVQNIDMKQEISDIMAEAKKAIGVTTPAAGPTSATAPTPAGPAKLDLNAM